MRRSTDIVKFPDYRLRRVAEAIDCKDPRVREIVEAMVAQVARHGAYGIAAPQLGFPFRVVVIFNPAMERIPPYNPYTIAINPAMRLSGVYDTDTEGCLSIPGVYARVPRPTTTNVCYTSLDGRLVEETHARPSLLYRVWQHEIDHLNGILITDLHPQLSDKELDAMGWH